MPLVRLYGEEGPPNLMNFSLKGHLSAIIGVALTIGSAIAAYVVGASAGISLLAGLLGISISLQIDSLVRASSLRADLLEIGGLTEVVLRNLPYTHLVRSIIGSLDQITSLEGGRVNTAAEQVLPRRAENSLPSAKMDLLTLREDRSPPLDTTFRHSILA